jgi:methyl-accepting chemotaxis protein
VKSAIELSAKSITTPTDAIGLQMIDASEQANDALAQMQNSSSPVDHIVGAVDGITSVMDNVIPIANTWDLLLKRIDLFTTIIDGIAEVRRKCSCLLCMLILI